MKEIVIHPHEDEHGNRYWQADDCPRKCIAHSNESPTIAVCDLFVQKLKVSFCALDECQE